MRVKFAVFSGLIFCLKSNDTRLFLPEIAIKSFNYVNIFHYPFLRHSCGFSKRTSFFAVLWGLYQKRLFNLIFVKIKYS